MNPFYYWLSWDKCHKCNQYIGRYYNHKNESLHLCCGCCKGTEFCDVRYLE